MTDEEYSVNYMNNGSERKTYFSKSFNGGAEGIARFAFKVLDRNNNEFILKKAQLLGETTSGKRSLKALFYSDSRKIGKLIVQTFDSNDKPVKRVTKQASFTGEEIDTLYQFLKCIKDVKFQNEDSYNLTYDDPTDQPLNEHQIIRLVRNNWELLQEALTANITPKDIVSFGYRKAQLELFNKLLTNAQDFEIHRKQLSSESGYVKIGNEAVWQKFFENNKWILGYGLEYIFNTELDGKKLEQVTSGANFYGAGKRIDGLLKSQGAVNSLCFCELKSHDTPLLSQVINPYRPESWQISNELAGAIAQVQRTIQKAIVEIKTKLEIHNAQGDLTGEELYLYTPKAFILIGNLNEFIIDGRINQIKYSSFEMFRKNLRNIEVLTYDELYQRATFICDK
jgi:hypothetical protein